MFDTVTRHRSSGCIKFAASHFAAKREYRSAHEIYTLTIIFRISGQRSTTEICGQYGPFAFCSVVMLDHIPVITIIYDAFATQRNRKQIVLAMRSECLVHIDLG